MFGRHLRPRGPQSRNLSSRKRLPTMSHMMTLARDSLENTLRGYAQGLLAQVAQDYNLDNQELIKRYLTTPGEATIKNGDGIPAPLLVLAQTEKTRKTRTRKEKPEKQCCKGITAKGQPCKFAALADGFCKKHSEQEKKKSEGTPPTTKTQKPQKPRHTHLVEEEPLETCQVCEVQGNSTKPEAPRQQFEIEGADDIKARLARMLAEAEGPEEAEEAATTEEAEEPEEAEETTTIEELLGAETETEEPTEEDEDTGLDARLRDILAEESDDEDDEEDQ